MDIALENPMNFDLEPLPPEFKFQEPYKDAKYSILVPVDFSDRSQVPLDTEHPHMRFVGREVRRDFPYTDPRTKKKVMKEFRGVVSHFSTNRSLFRVDYEDGDSQDVDYEELMQMLVPLDSEHPNFRFVGREVRKEFNTVDARKRKVMRAFKGKVKSYSPSSSLFEIVYSDGDCEDLDLDELMQVLIMGKKYGDAEEDWGSTRTERTRHLQHCAFMAVLREEVIHNRVPEKTETSDAVALDKSREPIYDDEPRNYAELMRHPEKDKILQAARKELQQLVDMKVGEMLTEDQETEISSNPNVKILKSKMVYKRKYQICPEDNKEWFLKWKGRLAVVGTGEIEGIDTVLNTFSPTIGFTAIRTLISLMCNPKYHVQSYDLSGAFLGAKLQDRAVYVRLPPDAGEFANKVIRATANIYGMKGSSKAFIHQLGEKILQFEDRHQVPASGKNAIGRRWKNLGIARPRHGEELQNDQLVDILRERHFLSEKEFDDLNLKGVGKNTYVQVDNHFYSPSDSRTGVGKFRRLQTDQCIYRYVDELGREMLLMHYVDDIVCATTDVELRKKFFSFLNESWNVTEEGVLNRFLGVHFERSADGWRWKATMGAYIDRIVQRFGLKDSRPADTPMDPGFVLKEDDFDEEPTKEMISEMRALIGSIGYCATSCRFDISYAVSVLSRHLARPCPKVIDAAKRVIRYLAGTRDFALEWWSSQEEIDSGDADTLFGATDASFAMDSMTRKSHGGFINFINHGPVSWKSGLQPIVTLSSCEAEYVALCNEVCETRYLRQLMGELGREQVEPTLIWEDNKAAILIAESECSSAGRSKHIDLRMKFVAQAISEQIVRIRYTPTDFNLADVMTKALAGVKFQRMIEMALGDKLKHKRITATDDKAHDGTSLTGNGYFVYQQPEHKEEVSYICTAASFMVHRYWT